MNYNVTSKIVNRDHFKEEKTFLFLFQIFVGVFISYIEREKVVLKINKTVCYN